MPFTQALIGTKVKIGETIQADEAAHLLEKGVLTGTGTPGEFQFSKMLSPEDVFDPDKIIPPPETPRPVAAPTPPPTFAETLATTKEEQAKSTQSLIDAIKESFQTRFLEAGTAQTEREARTRALNVRAGLAGSEFAGAAAIETEAVGRKEREAIGREQAAAVQVALKQADESVIKLAEIATREAGEEFERATGERERLLTEGRTNAQLAFTALGQQGKNYDDLSEAQKESLRQSTGFGDLALKGLFLSTLPDTELLSKTPIRVGSKAVFFQKDPTSASGFKKIEFDVGEDLEDVDKQFTIAPDGTPLIFNKRTGEASIAEGFREGQFAKPTVGGAGGAVLDRFSAAKTAEDKKRVLEEAVANKELTTSQATFIAQSSGIEKTTAQAKIERQAQAMKANINQLKTLAGSLENLSESLISKGVQITGQFVPFLDVAPEARTYRASRQAFTGPVARVISQEVGVLTDRDIKRAQDILPSVSEIVSSPETAKQKWDAIDEAIRNLGTGQAVSAEGQAWLEQFGEGVTPEEVTGDLSPEQLEELRQEGLIE